MYRSPWLNKQHWIKILPWGPWGAGRSKNPGMPVLCGGLATMKGLDTVESLSAGAARDPNDNMGTVIIIYIFVTFTHSNIDFHKLLMRISGTLFSSLSCYILRHTYRVTVCWCFTSLSKHKHLEPGNTLCKKKAYWLPHVKVLIRPRWCWRC